MQKQKVFMMKKKSLAIRLIRLVLLIVMFVYIGTFALFVHDVIRKLERKEINNHRIQAMKTASQISEYQNMVVNLSNVIGANETIQKQVRTREDSVGEQLYRRRNIINILQEYKYILKDVDEILLVTNDGTEYSSRDVRSEEPVGNKWWYKDFFSSGKTLGWSEIHESSNKAEYAGTVVTYIADYYSITSYKKIGTLCFSIRTEAFQDMLSPQRNELLIDEYGLIAGALDEGVLPIDAKKAVKQQDGDDAFTGTDGEWYVLSDPLSGDWHVLSKIDRIELRNNILSSLYIYFIIFGCGIAVLVMLLYLMINRVMHSLNELSEAVKEFGAGNLDKSVDIHTGDEIEELADVFNQMTGNIRALVRAKLNYEQKLQNMKMENLMLQINPHFIYNSMNSIVYMARIHHVQEIADYTNAFISLLQTTLKLHDSVYSDVETELKTISNYLYMQEFRYGNKFTYEIRCPDELKKMRILNVMLQPIVENAIFHGIAPKDGKGNIIVSIAEKEGILELTVADDGVGMNQETANKLLTEDTAAGGIHKIGIGNVVKRIKEMYGGYPYGLYIQSIPEAGTIVRISIPCQKAQVSAEFPKMQKS